MPDTLYGDSAGPKYADMTLTRGIAHAASDDDKQLMQRLLQRVNAVRVEHEVFRQWCDRADALYYPPTFTGGGSDLWPDDDSAKIDGREHVSVNTPAAYVDIPAALQAVEPIENVLATDTTEEARKAAAAIERVYTAWKQHEDFELKFHKAITTKGLYGRTAARVYWDDDADDGGDAGRACVEIIQQPRHLFLGYKTDAFEQLEWAAYRMYYEPNALTEEFGVEVVPMKGADEVVLPFVQQDSWDDVPARPWTALGDARIEVWDYWYRQPVWKGQKFIRMDTYNMVVAGNVVLRPPTIYKEYKGKLPYVVLYNTFVPGMPGGRADLFDVEPLIREKMERITSGAQMIANVTSDDAFQLTGPDAPTRVPKDFKPIKGGIIAPGPGNRVEVITPFIAQFQLEQFLGRIDREMAVVTGLNDLLLGLAPAQVLSSSKAINALIANYESRLSLRRKLLYKWRRDVWNLALTVMEAKMTGVVAEGLKAALKNGGGWLDITDPSLSPRDDMETATRAINLMNAKAWSLARTMDVVGVDDPETEQDIIRQERTDATLFPADVQVMAQLLGALQSMGLTPPAAASAAVGAQAQSGQNALNAAGVQATPQNAQSSQLPGDQGVPPAGPPEAAGGPNSGPLVTPPDNAPVLQGMVQNGQAKGRLMTQQKLTQQKLGRR